MSDDRAVVELNSLRGIAALVVVLYHTSYVFPVPDALHLWLAPVFNAHGSIVLFFVLSGYVLTFSWLRLGTGIVSAGRFGVRRFARIYPAIWIATAIGLPALYLGRALAHDAYFTAWMLKYVVLPTPLQVVLGLAGADNTVLMPLWTIYIELVGSLLIPVLVWGAARGRIPALAVILVLAVVACAAFHWPKVTLPARYLVYFAMGVTLALYPPRLGAWARTALIAGILAITVGPVLYMLAKTGEFQASSTFYQDYFVGFVEAVGAALMIAALTSGVIDMHSLRAMPLQRLGERSYSLYLVHSPVMILIASALPAMAPVQAMLILAVATAFVAIVISGLIFRYVELPGMALGKALTASPDRIFTFSRLRREPAELTTEQRAVTQGDHGN